MLAVHLLYSLMTAVGLRWLWEWMTMLMYQYESHDHAAQCSYCSLSFSCQLRQVSPGSQSIAQKSHLPCCLMSSMSSSVAVTMGMPRRTTSLPTYRSILPGAPPTYPKSASTEQPSGSLDTRSWIFKMQSHLHCLSVRGSPQGGKQGGCVAAGPALGDP